MIPEEQQKIEVMASAFLHAMLSAGMAKTHDKDQLVRSAVKMAVSLVEEVTVVFRDV